jgi:hypothetical protein
MAARSDLAKRITNLVDKGSKYIALYDKAPGGVENIITEIHLGNEALQAFGNPLKTAEDKDIDQSILDLIYIAISGYEIVIEELGIFAQKHGNSYEAFAPNFEWNLKESYPIDCSSLGEVLRNTKENIRISM